VTNYLKMAKKVIEVNTTSREEPLKSVPKVPSFMSLITCSTPLQIALKALSRSSLFVNHVLYTDSLSALYFGTVPI